MPLLFLFSTRSFSCEKTTNGKNVFLHLARESITEGELADAWMDRIYLDAESRKPVMEKHKVNVLPVFLFRSTRRVCNGVHVQQCGLKKARHTDFPSVKNGPSAWMSGFSKRPENWSRTKILFYYSMHHHSGWLTCLEHSNFFKVNGAGDGEKNSLFPNHWYLR